ncbi:competence protein CoiA family protein [Weissella cibaria]|uniref:competence protein CoiA family protein n=1 Tax=Weissella cibaria TaxID=137591 RepID=UPI0007A63C13|nr:competence protein CoiA family protein [Weissella cibaria]
MYIAQMLGTTVLMTADEADKRRNYVCPGCQTPVTVKKGRLKQAHFAHTSLQKCQALAEGESAIHLLGKLAMVDFFEVLVVEWCWSHGYLRFNNGRICL